MLGIETIEELLEKSKSVGVSDKELCEEAGIAVTTYGRWKRKEFQPNMGTWRRVINALHAIEARKKGQKNSNSSCPQHDVEETQTP